MKRRDGIALVANALCEAEESNARIERDRRIKAALERMLGTQLAAPSPLGGFSGSVLPEFGDPDLHSSYEELKDNIENLEMLVSKLKILLELLVSEEKKRPALFAKIDHELQEDKYHIMQNGLCISSLMILHGTTDAALHAILNILFGLQLKLLPIKEEMRAHYPKGRGRRRNARAYLVAEQLARFYLRQKREKPTWGVRNDYKSTPYSTALEEIFEILEIRAASRGPAKAACKGISEADLKQERQPINALRALSQNI